MPLPEDHPDRVAERRRIQARIEMEDVVDQEHARRDHYGDRADERRALKNAGELDPNSKTGT